MMIEWQNKGTNMQVATVGEFTLVVVPCVVQGLPKWQSSVDCSGRPGPCAYLDDVSIAKSWAETKLAALVAPFVETARAEGAAAEREACAQIAHERAETARLPEGWAVGCSEALAIESAIRARGAIGGAR